MMRMLYFRFSTVLLLATTKATCSAVMAPFRLGIRDSLMIAHSFHGHPAFGPAGGMHGATYTCDVEFCSEDIHPETQWVMDIGAASDILARVLAKYNLQNLDDVFGPEVMTTTEIHQDIRKCIAEDDSIEFDGDICVKLWESHKAWASYTG